MNFQKPTTCLSPKFNFGEKHVVRFWKFKNFKNTFDYLTAKKPRIRPIFGVSSLSHLHCKTTKAFNFCIFLHSYVNLFIVWPIPNTKNTCFALKLVIWKLGRMGLERILYLGVCLKQKCPKCCVVMSTAKICKFPPKINKILILNLWTVCLKVKKNTFKQYTV